MAAFEHLACVLFTQTPLVLVLCTLSSYQPADMNKTMPMLKLAAIPEILKS